MARTVKQHSFDRQGQPFLLISISTYKMFHAGGRVTLSCPHFSSFVFCFLMCLLIILFPSYCFTQFWFFAPIFFFSLSWFPFRLLLCFHSQSIMLNEVNFFESPCFFACCISCHLHTHDDFLSFSSSHFFPYSEHHPFPCHTSTFRLAHPLLSLTWYTARALDIIYH